MKNIEKLFCGRVKACDERSAGSMPLVALLLTSFTSVLVSIDSGARAERGECGDVVARPSKNAEVTSAVVLLLFH